MKTAYKANLPKRPAGAARPFHLTPKQAMFVAEYLIDLNATQAAIRAGYSKRTARQIGEQNLSKLDIAAAIETALAQRIERTEITQDMVLRQFARLGFSDIRRIFGPDGQLQAVADLDDDTAAAIASVEVITRRIPGDEKRVENVHKIKLADKVAALTQAGRHLGMFNDKLDLGIKHDLSALTDAELEALAAIRNRLAADGGGNG